MKNHKIPHFFKKISKPINWKEISIWLIEQQKDSLISRVMSHIIAKMKFLFFCICHDNYQTLIVANEETANWKRTSFEYFVQSKILRCSYVRIWKNSFIRFLSIMKMNVNHCHWIYFSFFISSFPIFIHINILQKFDIN